MDPTQTNVEVKMEAQRMLSTKDNDLTDYQSVNSDLSRPVDATTAKAYAFCFGKFVLEVQTRRLMREGQTVALGSRAFDLLMVLLESPGTVVPKMLILAKVWPTTHVDESNIRFQMGQLRGALGKDRSVIKTVPGRGYILTVPVTLEREPSRRSVPTHEVIGEQISGGYPPDSRLPGSEESHERPIIIIDDDCNIREAIAGLLESFGLQTEAFASVRDYEASLRRSNPGCFVLDVWLPDQNGLTFQNELQKMGIDVPVIFITGHHDVHVCVQAMKAGAHDFLMKPVRYNELVNSILLALKPKGLVKDRAS